MIATLPVEWIPSREALSCYEDVFTVPQNHEGMNDHPRLAELFVKRFSEGGFVVGVPRNLHDLFMELSCFYAPEAEVGLFYTYALKDKQVDVDKIVEILYLHNFFPQAVTPLISMFDVLKGSLVSGFDKKYYLPDHFAIDKFLSTREWFLDENFNPPIDFIWNVSQFWDRESITVTLREVDGDISRIMDLLAAGADPSIVKSQILGDVDAIPQSWLDLILDARDDKKTII